MDGTDSAVNSAPAPAAPTTFADAFASDASPASDPSQQSNDATAAVQPATDLEAQPQQGDDKRSPFIPRPRFDEVNKEKETLRQWKEQYAWAERVDPQAIQQATELARLYQQDRAGYVRQLLAEAVNDPELAPAIRSEAARLLGTRQQAQPAGPSLDQLVIDLGNGQSVPLGDLKQQWTQGVLEQIKPFIQSAEQFQQLTQAAERQQAADKFATGFFGELQSKPHFAELKPEIAARLAQTKLETDHPAEVKAAALSIYTQLFAERILPKLSQTAQSQLLDNLQQKAAASTSVNPTSAAPATARKVTRFDDPSLQW